MVGIGLPKYRCHKEVWALKIADISKTEEGIYLIVPENKNYNPFVVPFSYIEKHNPFAGGYYVLYKGGYESFSPEKEFIDGYIDISVLLASCTFGLAFEEVKKGKAMRLPEWKVDVLIKVQYPDEGSKMTAPYLYVESRFGRIPWKETMIELFREDWEVVG